MDAEFMESFFEAAMKQEPIDYDEYSDIDYEKQEAFKKQKEFKPTPLFNFADVKIKQEVLDEPEDNYMSTVYPESMETQYYTDHTYANMNLDIPIKAEFVDQIKTEHLEEENNCNLEDANLMISENDIKSGSMSLTSGIDDKIMEEIIFDFQIFDGLLKFYGSIDKTRQGDLVIDTVNEARKKQTEQIQFKCKYCFYTFTSFSKLEIHMQKHFIKNVYKCKTCSKELVSTTELIKHEFTHVSANTYPCRVCKKVYFNEARYKLHLKWHEKKISAQCTRCKKVLYNENMRACHEKKCNLKRKLNSEKVQSEYDIGANQQTKDFYSCDRCDRTFIYKVDCDLHLKGECFYKCRFCGKLLEDGIIFENHVKMMHPEKILYICKLCCKTFTYECDMIQHKKTHNESTMQVPQLVCNICSKLGEKSCKCIENINQNAFESLCKYCSKSFHNKLLLEQHLQADHSEQQLFPCDYCDEKFSSEWNKATHMIKHRYEFKKKTTKMGALLENFKRTSKLEKLDLSLNKRSKKSDSYVNNVINQYDNPNTIYENSNQQYGIEQGIKLEIPDQDIDDINVRSDTYLQNCNDQEFAPKMKLFINLERCNILRLQCKTCKKIFIDSNAKKMHQKEHKLNIKCTICCESFMSRAELEAHVKVHKEIKNIECDFCDETFSCLKDQENHILKHSAYRHGKFNCDICDKLFISQSTYRRHMLVHRA